MSLRAVIRKICLAVLCMSFLTANMGSVLKAQEAAKKVAEIVITGNQNISDTAIQAVITNLKPGGDYTPEAMEADRKAVDALGYFSSVTARTEDTPAGVRVTIDVVEQPAIKEIRIVGNKSISTERLLSLIRSKPGQVYNEQTFTLDTEAIQKEYADQGFFAVISDDAGIDTQTGVLTIPILEHTIESIDIVGNKKTPDSIFLREMKTKSGDILNRKKLSEDVQRIYNLGILDVTAYQRPQIQPGKETGKVAVVIPVSEAKSGQITLGVGYSSRQKLVGRVEINQPNFRQRLERLNLLLEAGQRATSTTSGGTSYQISFYEPWLDDKRTSMNVSAYNKIVYRFSSSVPFGSSSVDDGTYSERRSGGTLGFGRPLNDFTRLNASIRLEKIGIDTLPSSLDPLAFVGQISQPGPVRSLTLSGQRNTKDVETDPADGWFNTVSIEYGYAKKSTFSGVEESPDPDPTRFNTVWTSNPGGSGNFTKGQFDIRRYFSKGGRKENPDDKRKTFAFRLTGGIATGELLFSEQFFMGGSETLRGYREDRFWGERMLLLNAEYRIPFQKNLTGVLFADYGDAWKPTLELIPDPSISGNFVQHDSFKPQLGVGIGIRVVTPIGPLRLDYGVGSEGARTHFSIGHAF